MSKADEIIVDIMKTMEMWDKIPKPISQLTIKLANVVISTNTPCGKSAKEIKIK